MEDIIERLKKFVLAHPEMSKSGFIEGLDPTGKVVIVVNGEKKKITIDELESGHLNQTSKPEVNNVQMTPEQPLSNQTSAPVEEIEVMDEMPSNVVPFPSEKISNNANDEILLEQPSVDNQNSSKKITTLKDFEDAVMAKDETSVNKILESFAIDEKTGAISMNKAIKIVTDNSMNNVINAVRDNVALPNDLSKYDVVGKPMGMFAVNNQEQLNSLIDTSFKNILVYVEAARLKNIVYNDQQIEAAKKKYETGVHDKINVLGLNNKAPEITPDKVKEEKSITYDLRPDNNIKKAGFADILILTIIVLVYAAIIINLITKLK